MRADYHGKLRGEVRYCAFVAVTTATDVGVATPSIAAGGGGGGGGGAGGGESPEGGGTGAVEPLPPHPLVRTTKAMSMSATNNSRALRPSMETFDMCAVLR